MIITAVF